MRFVWPLLSARQGPARLRDRRHAEGSGGTRPMLSHPSHSPALTAELRGQEQFTAAGLPWYTRQNYPRVLEVMTDRESQPITYDRWLAQAERAIERARDAGYPTLKAHLDPDHFLIWCEERGMEPDNLARLAYVERVLTSH